MRVEYRTDAATERRWVQQLITEWVRGKRHPGEVRGAGNDPVGQAETRPELVGKDGLPSDS